jgi:hypothetical protein
VTALDPDLALDPAHWLTRLSPEEWVRAALNELALAEKAYARGDVRAGLAGAKRAAGMALNGALRVVPNDAWGRSYVDHVRALAADESAPEPVRVACRVLLELPDTGPEKLVTLRTKSGGPPKAIEAAKDVMAHAYAIVLKKDVKDA